MTIDRVDTPSVAAPPGPADSSTAPRGTLDGQARDNRRWWVLLVVSLVELMVSLDATIVNVMLPQVQRSIHMSATGLQWVMSIYVLLFGGLMLLGGRLTDVLGRRRILLVGIAVFTVGSFLASIAHGETSLLSARAIQGIAAAAASPAALSILVVTFPDPAERTKAFGIWGTVVGAGASIGTLLGGAIVDVGWRWAFYINIPIGIALTVAAVALVPTGVRAGARPKSDTTGAVVSTVGLLALVYGIVSTTDHGWTDPLTLGSFAVAVVLLTAFVQVERRSPAPLMPLRLFRQRGVVAGGLGQLVTAGIMLPCFFLLPIYMQTVLGYSPLKTGLAYIPTSLGIMVVATIVSKLVPKTGPLVLYVTGTALLAAVILLMFGSGPHSSYWSVLLPVTSLLGTGLVFCLIPTPVVGTAKATEEDAGTTSALLNASSQVGGAFGLAVAATVVASRSAQLVSQGVDPSSALNQALHRGFGVLLIWVAVSMVVGLVGFRGFRVTSDTTEGETAAATATG